MQKENSYENFMPLQASLDMLLKNENLIDKKLDMDLSY